MRLPHHACMTVTRRGEKELRLGAFLARGLEGMGEPAERAIAAIARSVASPVVRSIVARAHQIVAAGGTARLILAKPDDSAPSGIASGPQAAAHPGALAAIRAAGLACEVRVARNPRLIEAHEQLTIGGRVVWTGDSMRRDPVTCDAYESFVEDCPEIAAAAAATFDRLWCDCVPLAETAWLGTRGKLTASTGALPLASLRDSHKSSAH
jgi:hypothetical protein